MRRSLHTWLRACLLVCLAVLAACEREGATRTQLVVAVGADDEVRASLSELLVETFDPDQTDADGRPKAGGTLRFTLAQEAGEEGAVQLPFSFAVVPKRAARVLLLIKGLRGQRLVIEQKALVAYVPGRARVVSIQLRAICHGRVCGLDSDTWLEQTCAPDGECGEVPVLESYPHEPGSGELETLPSPAEARDAGSDPEIEPFDADLVTPDPDAGFDDEDATPDGSMDAEAGPLSDSDAEAGVEAETGVEAGLPGCAENFELDAGSCVPRDYCRGNPCGAAHTCSNGVSDYSCSCAATYMAVDAKRCVPKFTTLGAGLSHVCARRSDESVVCWGDNEYGQLGRTPTSLPFSTAPLLVAGLSGVNYVKAGVDHTCALLRNSTVSCWGLNEDGELGDGTTITRSTPTAVPNLAAVSKLAVGHYHSCVLLTGGTVWCWGANAQGQLGRSGGIATRPEQVLGVTGVVDIAAGGFNTCAVFANHNAVCWGHNDFGQLGNNTIGDTPTPVSFATDVAQIVMGEGHICARSVSNRVTCAGHNHQGQLGIGSPADSRVPAAVDVADVASLSAGALHTCVLQSSGSAMCWGENQWGEIGNGTMIDARSPVAVANLTGAIQLVTGGYQTCALHSDGNAVCWGGNEVGELGNGRRDDSPVPTLVVPPAN